jgi:hypothetical protein
MADESDAPHFHEFLPRHVSLSLSVLISFNHSGRPFD